MREFSFSKPKDGKSSIRYSKQLTKIDCGIVAIINACKWAGWKINYSKMYKVFAKKVRLRENKGMYLNVFEKIISNKAFPFKVVKKLKNVSPHKAGKLITKNRILMLATQTKNRDHLSLVVAKSPHTLTFVNQYLNVPVVSKFYKKDMKKHFRNNIIYVIEKK